MHTHSQEMHTCNLNNIPWLVDALNIIILTLYISRYEIYYVILLLYYSESNHYWWAENSQHPPPLFEDSVLVVQLALKFLTLLGQSIFLPHLLLQRSQLALGTKHHTIHVTRMHSGVRANTSILMRHSSWYRETASTAFALASFSEQQLKPWPVNYSFTGLF